MKLLVVSHACVVDVNQRVYRELELMGHGVTVVVPDRWRHVYSNEDIHPTSLSGFHGPLVPLPVWNPGSVPLHGYLSWIAPVFTRFTPDVAYIDEEPYSVAAFQWVRGAFRKRVRAVFFTAQNIPKKYPLPVRLFERYVWGHSSLGVCATGGVVEALRVRGYRGKTAVVPYAVDTARFRPGLRDAALGKSLGLQSRVVAFLGRLVEQKGVRVLLQAYRSLPGREATTLLLVGSGPLAEECRAQPGVVVVEGVPHARVPQYLALADLLVLPSLTTASWREQFGRAAIEAMACGLPVVGSDSGEIPNVLNGAGGGVVVPEGNGQALAEAIASLLGDAKARRLLGNQGRENVQRDYSTTGVAGRLAAALSMEPVEERA
jgi:glycosyltransferase involved in cell wall biosynthesis